MNFQTYQQLLTVVEALSEIDSDSFNAEEMIDFHTISDRLNTLINQSEHNLTRDSYRYKATKAKLEELEDFYAEYSTNPAAEIRLLNLLGIE